MLDEMAGNVHHLHNVSCTSSSTTSCGNFMGYITDFETLLQDNSITVAQNYKMNFTPVEWPQGTIVMQNNFYILYAIRTNPNHFEDY